MEYRVGVDSIIPIEVDPAAGAQETLPHVVIGHVFNGFRV
jgi:hypothetical protein